MFFFTPFLRTSGPGSKGAKKQVIWGRGVYVSFLLHLPLNIVLISWNFLEIPNLFLKTQGGLNMYPGLVLHAPGTPIRGASFTSRSVSFTPLVVNQMSFAQVSGLFKFLEWGGVQHLEMTSLWQKFHVSWRTCVVWFRICDCELCDNDNHKYVTMTQLIATRNARRTSPQ